MAYNFHKKALIRVPFFPYNELKHVDDIEYILSLDSFKEAIYIASPSLYEEVYIKKKRSDKINLSLIKYFTRACTRSTPYGLFAGCDTVILGDISHIEIDSYNNYKTYSRIDMEYLCDIIRQIEQSTTYRENLSYHVNTSLYYIGECIRFIEYNIINNKRYYSFSEIRNSEYIDVIIKNLCNRSMTIKELTSLIISYDISEAEAKEFINDLIDEQVLISELEPSVIGNDLIYQLKEKTKKIDYQDLDIDYLIKLLRKCDSAPIGGRIDYYKEINIKLYKITNTPKVNLLHIDCLSSIKKGSIGKLVGNTVLKGINTLSKITTLRDNEQLNLFKKNFYNKYEEQEIPLAIALDPQIGVGFGRWNETKGDINPLIDDLHIPSLLEQSSPLLIDNRTRLLIFKYEEAIKNESYCINIDESDLIKFNVNPQLPLSDQLYVLLSVLSIDEKKNNITILMDSAVGGSPAKLMSRFSYLDDNIKNFVDEIIDSEANNQPEKIIAEILHLPEDRIGNIQMHHENRKFGISYLSNPIQSRSTTEIIDINDIVVSIPGGNRVILRSKKHGKEILPVLTTAHNFLFGLPIYSFLCSLQFQDNQSLFFNWGNYFSTKPFLPRVQCEDIIFSPARWFFTIGNIPKQVNETFDDFYIKIIEWKVKNRLPDLVQIVEGDNKLLIDFNKKVLVKILIKEIKKNKSILIEEFLFLNKENNLIVREDDFFTNEIIMCLHKN